MDVHITTLKRGDPDFYQLLGPVFGSREFEKEVGIRAYDDAGKVWFCALNHGRVIGLASLSKGVVSDCYVVPDMRRNGVFSAVLDWLLQKTTGSLRATCTPASRPSFERAGFIQKKALKNYTKMELYRA